MTHHVCAESTAGTRTFQRKNTRLRCAGAKLRLARRDCLQSSDTSERSSAPLGFVQDASIVPLLRGSVRSRLEENISSELSTYLLCNASRQADHQIRGGQHVRPGRPNAAHFLSVNCSFPVRRTVNRVPLVRASTLIHLKHRERASIVQGRSRRELEHWWRNQTSETPKHVTVVLQCQ